MKWLRSPSDYYYAEHGEWTVHQVRRMGALRRMGTRWVLRQGGEEVDEEFFTLSRAKAFAEACEQDPKGRAKYELMESGHCGCGAMLPHFCRLRPRRLSLVESLRAAIEREKNGDPGD